MEKNKLKDNDSKTTEETGTKAAEAISKPPKKGLPTTLTENQEIKILPGQVLKISAGNYLKYFSARRQHLCKVCEILVKEKDVQKLTARHVHSLVVSLEQSGKEVETKPIRCILCADIIVNDIGNTDNEHNDFKLKEPLARIMDEETKIQSREETTKIITVSDNMQNVIQLQDSSDICNENSSIINNKTPTLVSLSNIKYKNMTPLKRNETNCNAIVTNDDAFGERFVDKNNNLNSPVKRTKPNTQRCKQCKKENLIWISGIIKKYAKVCYSCILKINQLFTISDQLFSCKACYADVFKSTEIVHVNGPDHIRKLISFRKCKKLRKRYCSLCNCYVNNMPAHALSTQHMVNFKDKYLTDKGGKTNNRNNIIQKRPVQVTEKTIYFEMTFDLAGQLICTICGIYIIPKTEENMVNHVRSNTHYYFHSDFMNKNKLKQLTFFLFFCGYCNIFITRQFVMWHVAFHTVQDNININTKNFMKNPAKAKNINNVITVRPKIYKYSKEKNDECSMFNRHLTTDCLFKENKLVSKEVEVVHINNSNHPENFNRSINLNKITVNKTNGKFEVAKQELKIKSAAETGVIKNKDSQIVSEGSDSILDAKLEENVKYNQEKESTKEKAGTLCKYCKTEITSNVDGHICLNRSHKSIELYANSYANNENNKSKTYNHMQLTICKFCKENVDECSIFNRHIDCLFGKNKLELEEAEIIHIKCFNRPVKFNENIKLNKIIDNKTNDRFEKDKQKAKTVSGTEIVKIRNNNSPIDHGSPDIIIDTKLKEEVKYENEKEKTKRIAESFCKYCKTEISRDVDGHICFNKGKKNKNFNDNYENNMKTELTTLKHIHYQMIMDKGILFCIVCRTYIIPMTFKNLMYHFNNHNHKLSLICFMRNNKFKVTLFRYFCEYCKVFLSEEFVFYHAAMRSHATNKINFDNLRLTENHIGVTLY